MAKVFEWSLLFAVLAGACIAVVQLQGAGGDALLGILGLLLFAAVASALRLSRFRGGRIGNVLPDGVDWRNGGLPTFTSHEAANDSGEPKRGAPGQ